MVKVVEKSLLFSFDDNHDVLKYDDSSFYRDQFEHIMSTKAVDIVCVTDDAAWLIEIKDYSHGREDEAPLDDVLVQKVLDTLAGLTVANSEGNKDGTTKYVAAAALDRGSWRVVFHIEGLDKLTQSFPNELQIKLTRRLRPIDKRSIVMSREDLVDVPWEVSEQRLASD